MPSPASTLPRLHLLASVPRRYHPTTSITTTSSYNSSIRLYSATAQRSLPTALARAGRAADLRSHPESGFTQEKLPDVKGMHHWDEGHATESEADVHADRENILGIFKGLEPDRLKKAVEKVVDSVVKK